MNNEEILAAITEKVGKDGDIYDIAKLYTQKPVKDENLKNIDTSAMVVSALSSCVKQGDWIIDWPSLVDGAIEAINVLTSKNHVALETKSMVEKGYFSPHDVMSFKANQPLIDFYADHFGVGK